MDRWIEFYKYSTLFILHIYQNFIFQTILPYLLVAFQYRPNICSSYRVDGIPFVISEVSNKIDILTCPYTKRRPLMEEC